MITSNEFIKKYDLKDKATSNMKIQQVLSSLSMNGVGIYLRDGVLNLILVLLIWIHQKVLIGFVI